MRSSLTIPVAAGGERGRRRDEDSRGEVLAIQCRGLWIKLIYRVGSCQHTRRHLHVRYKDTAQHLTQMQHITSLDRENTSTRHVLSIGRGKFFSSHIQYMFFMPSCFCAARKGYSQPDLVLKAPNTLLSFILAEKTQVYEALRKLNK